MKNPLNYQMSEYDCGPASMSNAISFLFKREEISPDIPKYFLHIWERCGNMDDRDKKITAQEFVMMTGVKRC